VNGGDLELRNVPSERASRSHELGSKRDGRRSPHNTHEATLHGQSDRPRQAPFPR
jgi:hypothetical protein